MAKLSNYTMNFSDGTLFFEVEPYAADGPESPSSETLFRTATSANTSLVILGKYFENYGERIQENLLHLLENFAMDEEPAYPVGGQIWYDRSQTTPIPKIYNPKKSVNSVSGLDEIKIQGNHIVRLNNLITKQRKLRIFSNIDFQSEDYIISSPTYDTINDITTIQIPNKLRGQRRNWYVGGWDDIIISSNGTIDLKASEIQNLIVGNGVQTDSQKSDYNPKSVINIGELERYIKSLTLPVQSGTLTDVALSTPINDKDIIAFQKSSDRWVNLSLSEVINGGNLNLNKGRIFGVKEPDGKIGDEVVTVDYLNSVLGGEIKSGISVQIDEPGSTGSIEHLADIKDVNSTKDPTYPEINKEGNLLYYDGTFWNGLSRSNFGSVGILSSDGTANYDYTNNNFYISTILEPDALINYNPNSSYLNNMNNMKDFITHIDDNILVSKRIGDELWGKNSKIVYGEYDGKQISLGYEANKKPDPLHSYMPKYGFEPENAEGVIFDLDVLNAIHTALDPKYHYDQDDLYFESSLARIIDDYPNIKLNDIINVINKDLGDISAYPFRQLITAPPAVNAAPGGFSKNKNLILDDFYIVGKSTLSIYADGKKLYASIPNTLTCDFITPADLSDPYFDDSNAKVKTLDENGNLSDKKLYEIDEVINESPPYVSIIGDKSARFSELYNSGQPITFETNTTSRTNPNKFVIGDVHFYPEHEKTYIFLESFPDNIIKGDHIVVDNIINNIGKIWGGYPTGLKYNSPTDTSNKKYLYQFNISLDKGITWRSVVIEGQKNVAQVVHAINEWSMNNDGNFSAFLERGKMGFISGKPGKNSSIRIVEDKDKEELPILKMYNCDGVTSPCGTLKSTDKDYKEFIELLKGKGFVIDGDKFSDFPVGTHFKVKGSDDNDETYTVKSIDKNICGAIPGLNEAIIRVEEEDRIKNNTPSNLGTIHLETENLFENMVGGVSGTRHYYYKFEDPAKWTEKFDSSDPNGDPTQDGDYSELGIPEYPSNTIIFNEKINPGVKLEIIINSTLNANV